VCVFEEWRLGELVFVNIAVAFGASIPPTYLHLGSSDVLHVPHLDVFAFLIIFFTARKSGMNRYPGVPSLLDTILRDATGYFLLMFFFQFSYQLLFITNRVGVTRYTIRVIDRVVLTVGVCLDSISRISCAVSPPPPRRRRDLRVVDVDLCLIGRAWSSFRSWHHASCSL